MKSDYIKRLERHRAILIAIVVLGTVLASAGYWYAMSNAYWHCAAEDEVVVIDHSCKHIDTLHGVHYE